MIKALIRLRRCAGWSAPLLFPIKKSQGFSCICSYDVEAKASWLPPGYAPAFYSAIEFTEYRKGCKTGAVTIKLSSNVKGCKIGNYSSIS